ncbi:hypothetical protein DSM100688_1876 [Bifidobacterium ramosum]|uniref:DUF4391 family protein n=1 Tax=Bifidobacterium ramosum TaxID=1798158 RepID=A0A6L4WYF5_9BIFI|nr:DUF4391 domain-containing protein [Bifidobacterium ramosum]KAB8287101.1 hypothetical protein DSM100688_1876 [Bifidobacterium ramosum]NEG71836.1 DUF4391 family protein [Bifidobacterium ramosum]
MSDVEYCGPISALDMGLPSTTAVPAGRGHLTKEGFYRGMDASAALRRRFVDDVESFTMLAQINERSTGIPSSETVSTIFVLGIETKTEKPPVQVMEHIARFYGEQTGYKTRILFLCTCAGECTLAVFRNANVNQGLAEGHIYTVENVNFTQESIQLDEHDLGRAWDAICSQVILNDANPNQVDHRIAVDAKKKALRAEIAKLESAHAKTRQIAKRNDLWNKLRLARFQLKELNG